MGKLLERTLLLAGALVVAASAAGQGKPETPLGIEITPEDVSIRVFSGGCTHASDFKFTSDRGSPPTVTMHRIRVDPCRAHLPDGVVLSFDWEAIGFARQPFKLANPLASPGSQGSVVSPASGTARTATTALDFDGQGRVRSLADEMSFCMDGAKYELMRALGGVRLYARDPEIDLALSNAVSGQYAVNVKGAWTEGPECRGVTVAAVTPTQPPADGGLDSRRWHSWLNLMPPGPPSLHVVGEVMLPASGSSASLEERSPPGFNPAILMLDLNAKVGTGPLVPVPVRFDIDKVEVPAPTQVQILRNGKVVLDIAVQEVH